MQSLLESDMLAIGKMRNEPGKPWAQAISARSLDPDRPAADIFADGFNRTFLAP